MKPRKHGRESTVKNIVKRRFLATLLTIALLFTVLLPALAAGEDGPGDPPDMPNHVTVTDTAVSYSTPVYTGSGSNRTGSTNVTLIFKLSDESVVEKVEAFTGINTTTTRNVSYNIGCNHVTAVITVTASGSNNNMNITGATAGNIDISDSITTETVLAPTCEDVGIRTHTCGICGDTYAEVLPPLGHDTDEGEVTIQPACEDEGEITYTCARCDKIITEVIPPLGHIMDEGVVTIQPTCEDEGEITYTCARCDKIVTEVIPPLGHIMDEGVVTVQPTCEDEGELMYTCARCDKIITEVIPPLGHDWGEWIVTIPASCEGAGERTRVCGNDPAHTETEVVPPLGHDYIGVITVPVFCCLLDGLMTYTCSRCGDTYTEIIPKLENHITVESMAFTGFSTTYSGSGSGRVAAIAVNMEFTLSDGSTVVISDELTGINSPHTVLRTYAVGCELVTVGFDIDTTGSNNSMIVTTVTAKIHEKEYNEEKHSADYSAVNAAISAANALNGSNYYDFSGVEAAVAAVVFGLDLTHQATVDAYAAAIFTAIEALIPLPADYTVLDAALEEAYSVNISIYTAESLAALANAVAAGEEIDRNLTILSQSIINQAAENINAAIAALEYKPADYYAVEAALGAAAALDSELYTEDSWAVLQAAIDAVIYGKNITEQETVDAYAAAILAAIEALVPDNFCEHDWDDGVVTTPATCISTGVMTYTCSICKETKTETIHIDPDAHSYGEGAYTGPTCEVDGYWTYECTLCGNSYTEQDIGSALGHNYVGAYTEPTCEVDGYWTHVCTRCGDSYTEQDTGSALGHNYVGVVTTPATCVSKGVMTYTCSRCGDNYTEEIPLNPGNHVGGTYESVITPATYDSEGLMGIYCSNCHAQLSTRVIPIITCEHEWDSGVVTTPATCVSAGIMTFTCSICKETRTEIIPIDPDAHAYGEGAYTGPTCDVDGYWTYVCTRCGDSYTVQDTGSALGHNYVGVVTTPATCISIGVMTFTCSRCDDSYTEEIPLNPDNHVGGTYESVITPATYDSEGLMGIYCSNCHAQLSTRVIPIITCEHDWGAGVVTTPATCVSAGIMTFTCSRCGDSYTEEIPINPDNHVGRTYEEVITPATNTTAGEMGIYCSSCDELLSTRTIPATGDGPGPGPGPGPGLSDLDEEEPEEELEEEEEPEEEEVEFEEIETPLGEFDSWLNPFRDVHSIDWFYEAIAYNNMKGLMNGTGDDTFSPSTRLSRAMLVTILWRRLGSPIMSRSMVGIPFTDVSDDEWYSEAITWASANGIVLGYGDGRFRPDNDITREELATILHRFAIYSYEWEPYGSEEAETAALRALSAYSDAKDISEFAVKAMTWANSNGLITGRTDTTLAPKEYATRAEAAMLMMRYTRNITNG